MRKILDYSVSHTFERNRSTYFCGKKEGEDQPVIIQILDPHLFSAVEIARLKMDYDLIKTLNITGTQKIIDLIVLKDQLVFIPEDFPAITLRDFMLYRKMDLAFHSYHAGEPLLQLCDDIAKYCELVEKQKQTSALFISQQYHALSEAGLFLYSVEFLHIGEKRGA